MSYVSSYLSHVLFISHPFNVAAFLCISLSPHENQSTEQFPPFRIFACNINPYFRNSVREQELTSWKKIFGLEFQYLRLGKSSSLFWIHFFCNRINWNGSIRQLKLLWLVHNQNRLFRLQSLWLVPVCLFPPRFIECVPFEFWRCPNFYSF